MKRTQIFSLLLLLLLTTALTGCSGSNAATRQNAANQVEETLNAQMAAADAQEDGSSSAQPVSGSTYENDTEYTEVDYDLTEMNSDMVYSTVFNMTTEPDTYLGKTVKMEGTCIVYQDPDTGKYYYSCMIADAAACCAQGMEFVWGDGSHSDSEYPQEGEKLCVIGVFDTYTEGEYQYCRLDQSAIEVVEDNAAA